MVTRDAEDVDVMSELNLQLGSIPVSQRRVHTLTVDASSMSAEEVLQEASVQGRPAFRVSLSPCNNNNLGTVRKLNSVLFPIRYAERFYKDILLPEAEPFCQLLYFNDIPVGTVCCRFERVPDAADGETKLYIMTMGVLAPYRGLKLGSRCLRQIFGAAAASTKPRIKTIYLHVQVSNAHARAFYEHHGFTVVRLHSNYYKKIEPRDAWVLEYDVHPPAVETT